MSSAISQQLSNLKLKFDTLNQRERWLIGVAALCVLYGLYGLLLAPIYEKQTKIEAELQQSQTQLNNMTLQVNQIMGGEHTQKSAQQLRIDALNAELAELSQTVESLQANMVLPNKVPDLLSDILNENAALSLVSLTTLPPTNLLADQAASPAAIHHQEANIFKHGVEVTIEGRYLDLLTYLNGLEKMPWQMLWNGATLTVEDNPKTQYPLSQLKLTVYTVSLDKAWLSI